MSISFKKLISLILFFVYVTAGHAEDGTTEKNLLKWNFDKITEKGIPEGYTILFKNESKALVSTFKEEGVNVIKLELPEQGTFFLDTVAGPGLELGKSYIFTVQLKIEEQNGSGPGEHFFYVCLYNTRSNEHVYSRFSGEGDSNGWMTVVIRADTVKNPDLAGSKIFFRGYGVSGTYYIKDPYLVEVPYGQEIKTQIILSNNKALAGGFFRMKDISQLSR